jgi:hypothetical protein
MTLIQRKKLLIDYKLDSSDFYVINDEFCEKIILRRTGIDKLERQIQMSFTIIFIQTVPYGTKVCTTIVGEGITKSGERAVTTASSNPDNCKFDNFAEIAEKRCRHRLILKICKLYEHDIFSEAESEGFTESRHHYDKAVEGVKKMLKAA